MVFFYEENHSYINLYGERYESVSGLIDPYKEKFNWEFNSIRSAFRALSEQLYKELTSIVNYDDPALIELIKNKVGEDVYKEIIINAELLKIKWKEKGIDRSEYGTNEHSYNEEEDMIRGYKINPIDGLKYKVIPRQSSETYQNSLYIPEVLKMRENICMLECLNCDHESKTAGQEDVSFFKYLGGSQFGVFNMDYKTDAVIDYKSFFNRGFRMMSGELNYFMDCNFYVYSVKQSMYSIMQEKMGCKIMGNFLKHIPEGKEPKYINTQYYRKHALAVLEKRINFLKNN